MRQTKVYGHRGAMGEYPENTILSFKQAINQGVDGIELDVQLTKDGEVVVIHDEKLDRTSTGTGYVKNHTLEELKQYSAGEKFKHLLKYEISWNEETVPTLTEVMDVLEPYPHIELNIELKTNHFRYPGIEKKVLDITNQYGGNRKIVFSSFHLPSILAIHDNDSLAEIAWLTAYPISHPNEYGSLFRLEGLHVSKDVILKYPHALKDRQQAIRAWTANGTDEIKQLLDLKVDAIVTDFPEKAVFFRSERALLV